MKKSVIFILRIRKQPNKLSDEFVHHGQIEWPKVVIEGVVYELLIYGEKVSVYIGSWGSWPRHEIQPIFYYLNIRAVS